MISIMLNREAVFEVGDQVSGTFSWTPKSSKQPRGIEVRLHWHTEGRGSLDERTAAKMTFTMQQAIEGMPMEFSFDLLLPADGPVSYNGDLLRIIWEVQVEVDLPWAINESSEMPLTVVPRQVRR